VLINDFPYKNIIPINLSRNVICCFITKIYLGCVVMSKGLHYLITVFILMHCVIDCDVLQ